MFLFVTLLTFSLQVLILICMLFAGIQPQKSTVTFADVGGNEASLTVSSAKLKHGGVVEKRN